MFHEMLSDIDDFAYMDVEEIICAGIKFVEHYKNYDLLKCDSLWHGLGEIKRLLDYLYENDLILEEAELFVISCLGDREGWKSKEVFEDIFSDSGINAYLYAKKFSILHVAEKIKTFSGIFEECCREWFMPGLCFGVNKN